VSTIATRIGEISLVCVPTPDQDRAIEFYEALGFEKRTDMAFGGAYRWVEVYPPKGTTGIALAPPPDGSAPAPLETGITLTTDDIDATHAEFKALGVDVDAEVARIATRPGTR
jgi:catechol 2,3-dioxygenase-like lactoylglutathione lyase family enzyme